MDEVVAEILLKPIPIVPYRVAVDLLGHLNERLPLFGVINDAGDLDVVLPVLDVFDYDLIRGVDRECARNVGREVVGDAPEVDDFRAALLGHGISEHEGRKQELYRFVLIDVALRFPAEYCSFHVFSCCKHSKAPFCAVFCAVFLSKAKARTICPSFRNFAALLFSLCTCCGCLPDRFRPSLPA